VISACLVLAAAAFVGAADVPVSGVRLALRASMRRAEGRVGHLIVEDAGIGAPFADPRVTPLTLVLHAGAEAGQCFVTAVLDPARWEPIRGDGAQHGYRYRDRAGSVQGIRRVIMRPGRMVLRASGVEWPCDLAAAQRIPVSVVLRLAGTRWCAEFGGTVRANKAGRFAARAAGSASCPKTDLTVANLNLLHGIFCPAGTANCRLEDRVDLLFQWIAASGCPDLVTLQEIWAPSLTLIEARLAAACPFPYVLGYTRHLGVDDSVVLSRYPLSPIEVIPLYRDFRHLSIARVDHPMGPVDVFTTHLASGSDGAQNPCDTDCPAECVAAGAATVRQCQGVQVGALVTSRHDLPTPAVVTGDFNEDPASFVYTQLVGRGWIDSYLAAGNPECEPISGVGCTSGRADEELSGLESPVSNETERIDYVFVVPQSFGTCTPDGASDDDGDGSATRIFADLANPFAPTCGPTPEAICWPSDHEGAELDLNCG